MSTYRITNTTTGQTIGDYEADSPRAALDAMARDAGYRDFADSCLSLGTDGDELRVEGVDTIEIPVGSRLRSRDGKKSGLVVEAEGDRRRVLWYLSCTRWASVATLRRYECFEPANK